MGFPAGARTPDRTPPGHTHVATTAQPVELNSSREAWETSERQPRREVWESKSLLVPAAKPMGFSGLGPDEVVASLHAPARERAMPGPLPHHLMPDIRLAEVIQHERPDRAARRRQCGGQIFRVGPGPRDDCASLERF